MHLPPVVTIARILRALSHVIVMSLAVVPIGCNVYVY